MNAGQLSLESSWPGSTRPAYNPLLLTIFIRDTSMRCVLYIKNVQQKFEGIMFGSI